MKRDVRVGRSLIIPAREITLSYTTSGGPGGQHANRSSTRVELSWNVRDSGVLGPRQRARILEALKGRIDGSGNLRLAAGRRRSQLQNAEIVHDRLAELVGDALRPRAARRPTTPTASATERRLRAKRRRGEIKRMRTAPADE